jgi:hypothetical protein
MSNTEKKRILYPMTESIRSWDIPYALQLLGIEPLLAELPCHASSDAKEDAQMLSDAIREQQAIHYLGIPLKGTYNIYDVRRWNLYGSLGVKLEMPE